MATVTIGAQRLKDRFDRCKYRRRRRYWRRSACFDVGQPEPIGVWDAAGTNDATSQGCMAFKGINRGSKIGHDENLGNRLENLSRLQRVWHTKGSLRSSDQPYAACCD